MQRPVGQAPSREAYLVFSQRDATSPDAGAWDAQAHRFFGARLSVAPDDDGQRIAVTPDGALPAGRRVRARKATQADYAVAAEAEAGMYGGGLSLLARRCPVIWEVARETEPDPDALRIAAVLASVLLGPVVDARGPEIFGVKTAREKLESAASPR